MLQTLFINVHTEYVHARIFYRGGEAASEQADERSLVSRCGAAAHERIWVFVEFSKQRLNESAIFAECVGVCGGPYMSRRPRASERWCRYVWTLIFPLQLYGRFEPAAMQFNVATPHKFGI